MSAPVFVGDFPPGSPEWHAARQQGIGGSEIAAVLGLSPWESRFSLWHRKRGLLAAVEVNDSMYWGTRLEPVIRDEFERRHAVSDGIRVEQAGTWRHEDRPWQVANPDGFILGLIVEDGETPHSLLEIKTARDGDRWGEPGTDEIPVYYRTQCLWYLDVFGLQTCHVAVLIAGSDYREYRVEYAADEAAFMRDKARDFLDELDTNQRPDIDSHSATYQVVRELHPDIEDVKFDVPGEIATPYLDALTAYKAAEAEKKRAAAVLADAMGNARRAMFDGDQIAMRAAGNPPSLRATPARKTSGQKVVAA
jgi:putative phage-type endonuclease